MKNKPFSVHPSKAKIHSTALIIGNVRFEVVAGKDKERVFTGCVSADYGDYKFTNMILHTNEADKPAIYCDVVDASFNNTTFLLYHDPARPAKITGKELSARHIIDNSEYYIAICRSVIDRIEEVHSVGERKVS